MLDFIIPLKGEKIDGLLDTEEKVKEARENLEKSTEPLFEKLKIAKMKTLAQLHTIILD